jgi:serine/threonine-protein kinase RsbW
MTRKSPTTTTTTQTPMEPAAGPGSDAHVIIEMLSQPRYLSGARDLVSAVSKRFGFSEADCGQIALAVDEALCNVIRHGYERREDGKIWLSIWPHEGGDDSSASEAGGIRIVIEDEAEQVDPTTIKGRDLDDVRPGGLGVYIIQQVMDHTRFEPRPDASRGMRVEMIKTHGSTTSDGASS